MATRKNRIGLATSRDPAKFEEQVSAVLQLQSALAALRTHLKAYMREHDYMAVTFQKEHGVNDMGIRRILAGNEVVCSEKVIMPVSLVLDVPDIGDCILNSAKALNMRLVGLAAHPVEVLDSAFHAVRQYVGEPDTVSIEQFASRFGSHAPFVANVIALRREALEELRDPAMRASLARVLEGQLAQQAPPSSEALKQTAPKKAAPSKSSLQASFAHLVDELRATGMSRKDIYTAVGVARVTFDDMYTGRFNSPRLPEVTAKLSALRDRGRVDDKGTAPVCATLPATAFGTTSEDGIMHVLTAESFTEIEGDPGEAFTSCLIRVLEQARALLAAAAQLKDDRIRARIRDRASQHVEELSLTTQLFSIEFPNQLTPLIDAQRATWSKLNRISTRPAPRTPRNRGK